MAKKKATSSKQIEANIAESFGDGSLRSKNPLIERKIIASCFHRKPELQNICSRLSPDSFSDPRYKVFFQYIAETYESGKLPDQSVCLSRAQRSMEYDIDPEDYKEAMDQAFDAGSDCDIEQVCAELSSLYLVRKMLGLAGRISANVAEGKPAEEMVGQAEEAIRKLTGEAISESTLKTLDEIISDNPQAINELIDPPMDGIPTPWAKVNSYIYGFRPKQLYVIGARPGVGKTAALLQIADYAANLGNVVAVFSHEMDTVDMWGRILCSRTGVRSSDVMHRQVSNEEKNRISDFIKHAAPKTLVMSDRGGRTPLSLRSEIARIKARFGRVDMVCIDYLQLMESPGHARDNRVNEVGAISRALKRMAMEFNTRMIVAAQLNRMVDNRPGDTRPKLSDLRESGSIEQDADLCLFLHRPSMYKKVKDGVPPPPDEFIIEKHRRGKTGIINMEYVGDHYKYIEGID